MSKTLRGICRWLAGVSSFVIAIAASGQSLKSQVSREVSVSRQEGVGRSFTNGTAHSDVVTDWNTAALNAIRAGRTPPPIASRALAILHASIYDAVNGIDRRHEAYLVQGAVPASASEEAAASAAAHRVLVMLFPANAPSFDDLHTTILTAIPKGPQKNAGIAWGETVADEIAASRPEPESSIFYFEIVGTLSCYCTTGMDALKQTSWTRTKQGYTNLKRLYGTSNLKANRFAFLAFVAKDRSAANEGFASITEPNFDIWNNRQVFEYARMWAAGQEADQ